MITCNIKINGDKHGNIVIRQVQPDVYRVNIYLDKLTKEFDMDIPNDKVPTTVILERALFLFNNESELVRSCLNG